MPLAQMTIGTPGASVGRQRRGERAQMLRRRREQQRIDCRRIGQAGGGADRGIERHAGQEQRIRVVAVDRGDRLRLVRPEHDIAPGAAQHLRQRRAPGAAADDADALHSPSAAVTVAGGSSLG